MSSTSASPSSKAPRSRFARAIWCGPRTWAPRKSKKPCWVANPRPRERQTDMLTLENITAGYGDTTVLRDVTIEVPAGEVVALLGPNGAGKTTLLRVASGL